MLDIARFYPDMYGLVEGERRRQASTLMMIASENYQSAAVEAIQGTPLGNKYAEGYPGKRYYQGQEFVDQIEGLAKQGAKDLFHVPHVNVQPYSGSPANFEVLSALLKPGDKIMGLSLDAGGHLTHGAKPSATSKFFESEQYGVDENGWIDYDQLAEKAREHKPKIIIAGITAYSRQLDWQRFAEIADANDAILMADISHVAGLVAGGAYPSPVDYVDVVTTTTHKTLRGPRGAMIMVTDKGLSRDPRMGAKIDSAVFPGLQGGPHMNTIAGIAVALEEAKQPQFREYAAQVVKNAQRLGNVLKEDGLMPVTGGTDSHLLLVDLQRAGLPGKTAAEGLEEAGIVLNYNAVPFDPNPPMNPSGIRIGTAALTSRGMREPEMDLVGGWIAEAVSGLAVTASRLGIDRKDQGSPLNRKKIIEETPEIGNIRGVVQELTTAFPIQTTYF